MTGFILEPGNVHFKASWTTSNTWFLMKSWETWLWLGWKMKRLDLTTFSGGKTTPYFSSHKASGRWFWKARICPVVTWDSEQGRSEQKEGSTTDYECRAYKITAFSESTRNSWRIQSHWVLNTEKRQHLFSIFCPHNSSLKCYPCF